MTANPPPPGQQPGHQTGQPTPPKSGAPSKKEKPEPSEEERRFYARYIGWLLLALIVGYAGLQMPLPWRLVTIAASLAGLAGAITLLVLAIRKKLPAMVLIGSVIFAFSCGYFLLLAGMQTVFWEASVEFDDCMRSAITERATDRCFTEYEQDIIGTVPGLR